jgi:hypothetical protein
VQPEAHVGKKRATRNSCGERSEGGLKKKLKKKGNEKKTPQKYEIQSSKSIYYQKEELLVNQKP